MLDIWYVGTQWDFETHCLGPTSFKALTESRRWRSWTRRSKRRCKTRGGSGEFHLLFSSMALENVCLKHGGFLWYVPGKKKTRTICLFRKTCLKHGKWNVCLKHSFCDFVEDHQDENGSLNDGKIIDNHWTGCSCEPGLITWALFRSLRVVSFYWEIPGDQLREESVDKK